MALTESSISRASANNDIIRAASKEDYYKLLEAVERLKSNGEFQKFIEGTPLGADIFERIQKLIEQRERLDNECSKLCGETDRFLAYQRMINSR